MLLFVQVQYTLCKEHEGMHAVSSFLVHNHLEVPSSRFVQEIRHLRTADLMRFCSRMCNDHSWQDACASMLWWMICHLICRGPPSEGWESREQDKYIRVQLHGRCVSCVRALMRSVGEKCKGRCDREKFTDGYMCGCVGMDRYNMFLFRYLIRR